MKSIKAKIILSSFLPLLILSIFLLTTLYLANNARAQANQRALKLTLFREYDKQTEEAVELALAAIRFFYQEASANRMHKSVAMEMAKQVVREMSLQAGGYFRIDDTSGSLIMHPSLPEKEGQSSFDLGEPEGPRIIQSILAAAAAPQKSGFTEYSEEKPANAGSGKLSSRRIYSKLFPEWSWIISGGGYVDEIEQQLLASKAAEQIHTIRNLLITAVCLLLTALISCCLALKTGKGIAAPLRRIAQSFAKDENGKYSLRFEAASSAQSDEIRLLVSTLGIFTEQLRTAVSGLSSRSETLSGIAERIGGTLGISPSPEDQSQKSNPADELAELLGENSSYDEPTRGSDAAFAVSASPSSPGEAPVVEHSGAELFEPSKELLSDAEKSAFSIQQISASMKKSSESAMDIEKASNMLDSIAAQTNYLALNASIEAGRTGEAGKGFAGVAEEIRKLSDQSNSYTNEIRNILRDLKSDSQSAIHSIEEVDQTVFAQADYINKAELKFQSIAQAIGSLEFSIHTLKSSFDTIDLNAKAIKEAVGLLSGSEPAKSITDNSLPEMNSSEAAAAESYASLLQELIEESRPLPEIAEGIKKQLEIFYL